MNPFTSCLAAKQLQKSFAIIFIFMLGVLSIIASSGNGNGSEPGTLQLENTAYSAVEGSNPSVTVTVTRTAGKDGDVSVDYTSSDGTATAPADYSSVSGSLNWADGDDAAKTVSIAIVDDSAVETTEHFTFTLSNAQVASLGANSSATISISDNDALSSLQLGSTGYSVTEGLDATVNISVERSGGSSGAASVDYATSDNTALAASDYTATSGTLSWADGDAASKTFTVSIANDSAVELVEAFNVTLSNAVNATLGANKTATVTVIDNDSITVTGTVFAPNGSLAYKKPGLLQRLYAAVFGSQADAAISNLTTPVGGATVAVYSLDSNGDLLSTTPVSSSTTDSLGTFTLLAPIDAPHVQYIVRASGATEQIDSRIVSTHINVDPSTDATSKMVTSLISNYAQISTQEVSEMQQDIAELVTQIDAAGLNATVLSNSLFSKAESLVGQYNVLRSKLASGQICGKVTSATAVSLQGILMVVQDYDDWLTRARTYTNASGDYCLNVPVQGVADPDGGNFSGEYIIGAINRTTDSDDIERSASEWLGSGTSYTKFEAIKISVANTSPVMAVDFTLEPGARIRGTVKSSGSLLAVEGARVNVRDYDTGRQLASAVVEADGSYQVNVIPGNYLLTAVNKTTSPYGSEIYNGLGGSKNPNFGLSVSASAGDEVTIDFELENGSQLSGNINDGSPVVNTRVRVHIAGGTFSLSDSTDRNGDYNIWLKAGSYDLYAYGQRRLAVDLSSSQAVDFNAAVSTITGQLADSSSLPVGHVTMRLYDPAGEFLGYGESDSYGVFTVYSELIAAHLLEARITRESTVAGIIYINQTRLLSGDPVNIISTGEVVDLATYSLPDGGMLKGKVYADSSGSTTTPIANFRVQVRDGGTTLADRFLQVRTKSDGSYRVALPAAISYDRVKMRDATGADSGNGNCDGIAIAAGVTTVLNFYDGDNSCELNP
ncbi:MAG: hypothetical protein OEY11_07120 [Gammaproteobacteria bacterium]|nr:hypothetical protein [Gammaproteobacteria bacterium]